MMRMTRFAPGVLLCMLVTAAATLMQNAETRLIGEPYLEALVLAILLGVVLRKVWTPGPNWAPGIGFSAKILLEVAVVLLGASVATRLHRRAKPAVSSVGKWPGAKPRARCNHDPTHKERLGAPLHFRSIK